MIGSSITRSIHGMRSINVGDAGNALSIAYV